MNRTVGRPRSPDHLLKVPFSTKLPRWLLEWMRSPERTNSCPELIEYAMKATYRIGRMEDLPK